MKKMFLLILMLTDVVTLRAQSVHLITTGTIEFEKIINTYALVRSRVNVKNGNYGQQAFENYQKSNPQFKVLKSTLTFNKDKTYFEPLTDSSPIKSKYIAEDLYFDQYNQTFTNFSTATSATRKKVFEKNFLINDSPRAIKWKITDEIRTVAGFICRRANAVIMDSVYVVAFYTNQIPVPGGPESFTGLPGMILELAMPHEHIRWLATKVTESTVPLKIEVPSKGNIINNSQLKTVIQDIAKGLGAGSDNYMKAALL